ncbi:MAG TPA: hypothetical protein VGM49_07010, partial [Candidatus Limnocylindrales bacterium]
MRDPIPATPDLSDAITDARAEVAAASRQLTDRANDVFRATGAVVVETVEQWVEAFVLGQPDRTEKLGKSGVDRLRADLVATKARLPGESAKRLVGAFSWTFPVEAAWIGESDRAPLYEGGGDLPWMIDDAIRLSAAAGGRLAAEAGYQVTPRSHWELSGEGSVQRYLGPFATPPRLVIALRSYSDARLRYFRKLRALRRLEA